MRVCQVRPVALRRIIGVDEERSVVRVEPDERLPCGRGRDDVAARVGVRVAQEGREPEHVGHPVAVGVDVLRAVRIVLADVVLAEAGKGVLLVRAHPGDAVALGELADEQPLASVALSQPVLAGLLLGADDERRGIEAEVAPAVRGGVPVAGMHIAIAAGEHGDERVV